MKKARGLKRILGAGLIGLASLLPMKNAQAQQVWDVNPYIQPRSRIEDQSWNKLWIDGDRKSREEYRDSTTNLEWEEKIKDIPYIPGKFVCSDFASLITLDMHGFPELGKDSINGTEDNGRFNLPVYYVSFAIPNQDNHAETGMLIDGNGLDLDNWDIRARNGSKYGRDIPFPENCDIVIKKTIVNNKKELTSFPFIKFKRENGISTLVEASEYISDNIPTFDGNSPGIKINSPKSDTLYEPGEVEFDFEVEDPEGNLDSVLYSLDGKNWIKSEKELKKSQIFKEGDYKLYVKANDWSPGNKINRSIDSVNFKVKDNSTGMNLEERTRKNNFNVYPNPARDRVYFKSENPGESRLKIYNIQGQELEEIIFNNEMEYDFAKYNPGIYFYKTESGESGKIIKK